MKYPGIGAQELSEFKKKHYIYVDKTECLYKLITTGKYYFLSRPRRFGKSLLINTLRDLFSTRKDLFKGTWIYNRINWKPHPVIHIDFSRIEYKTLGLEEALELYFDTIAKTINISFTAKSYQGKFIELIEQTGKNRQVAILIDEYDKPVMDYIESIETAEKNREILKNFYAGLKGCDAHIRFLMITGVSKFSKISIFSDLNHLRDITVSEEYPDISGYTLDEIKNFYQAHLRLLQEKFGLSEAALLDRITEWYNGYSWDGKTFVYNPFSIINLLADKSFRNYWFKSGTPTFLIRKLKDEKRPVEKIGSLRVQEAFFDKFELGNLDVISLMFQSGYLTIKKYDPDKEIYFLAYPNKEVEQSFLNSLLEAYTHKQQSEIGDLFIDMVDALESGNMDQLISNLKALFASIPYNIFIHNVEACYHSVIFLALKLVGIKIHCEVQTNTGRIDAVIETTANLYIVEFKMGSAQKAMDQIRKVEYWKSYSVKSPSSIKKQIRLMAVGFSSDERNISEYIVEDL